MKGYTFHAELPDNWASKSGCMQHMSFTRRNIREMAEAGKHFNVVAVCPGREHLMPHVNGGSVEAYVAVFARENSDVNFGSTSFAYLRERTVRIDEVTARKCHPRLFVRLDD